MAPRPLLAALAGLLLLGAPPAAAGAEAAPPAPRPLVPKEGKNAITTFTALPRFTSATLSPQGKTLGVLSLEKGRRILHLVDLATRKVAVVRPGGESMIGAIHWVSEERLVAELVDQTGWLAQPVGTGELYAVNADGSGGTRIYGYRAGRPGDAPTRTRRAAPEMAGGTVIRRIRSEPGKLLISSFDFHGEGDRRARVLKLDAGTGVTTPVAVGPMNNTTFVADEKGELGLAVGLDDQVKRKAWFRDAEKGWLELNGRPGFGPQPEVFAVHVADRTVEVVEPMEGGFGLYLVSVDGGEKKLLARTEIAPPTRALREPGTGRLLAVGNEPDLPVTTYVVPEHPLCQALAGLEAAHPGQYLWPVSGADGGKKLVVAAWSDRHPYRLLMLDVEKRTAEPLLDTHPWIDPEAMVEMTAFHIGASDGTRIHGYLTSPALPPGAPPPPLVVYTHGGPHWVRDHWAFNPDAQLFASQGYAVLQVNYRGSGGYGDEYQEKGYRRWGDRVMQDIVDSIRWAVKKGKADEKRVCTFGGSFGGYASLQLPVVAPELFRCAIGVVGVYDLTLMATRGDISWSGFGRGFVRTAVGDDEAQLKEQSPLSHVDRLRLPVFLIHGARDMRVPIVHAERLRDALTEAGRPPRWLVETGEGHGFYDEGARENMYRQVLEFLGKHTAKN